MIDDHRRNDSQFEQLHDRQKTNSDEKSHNTAQIRDQVNERDRFFFDRFSDGQIVEFDVDAGKAALDHVDGYVGICAQKSTHILDLS